MTATDHRVPSSRLDGARRLPPDDVGEIVTRWQRDGDLAAREEMVVRFMPMARRLASRYRNHAEPFEDLVQVANLGLLGAIDRFDPSNGAAFASFAVPTILGELKRHFRNTGWSVHVPRGAQEIAMRVDRAVVHLTAKHGRAPSVPAIVEHLNVSVESVLEGLDASEAHFARSLDAPARIESTDDAASVGEMLGADDDRLGLVELSASLSAAVHRLPPGERQALALRVQHDMKQSEIAEAMGCSQMHVSRLLRRATTTLRELTALSEPAPPRRRST